MKINHDKQNDITYVKLSDEKISHTKAEQDWLLFDCNKLGQVVGVEILNASMHESEKEILKKYSLVLQ